MAAKKRNPSKRKTQRRGLSANPQRRAEQLEKERSASAAPPDRQGLAQAFGGQRDGLRELAYLLAGGAEEAPWWRDSHESVLRKARALDWATEFAGIEEQTCDLVGGQFYDNLQAYDGGHHQAQWLRALAEQVGAALREAIADDGDWRPLWTLLSGMALTTPEPAADEREDSLQAEFPEIKDPQTVAVQEIAKATLLLAERSVAPPLRSPVSGARPTSGPVVARDAYGSRFLVAAPFGYQADVPDHWYAWDIDTCWTVTVTRAGTFASADEALAEWRRAAGTAADSELSPVDAAFAARLLGPCLGTGMFSNMLRGDEPRELIRELYRMRRRARALVDAATPGPPAAEDSAPDDVDQFNRPTGVKEAFRDWYRARHPSAPKGIAATAETIIGEWGPGHHLDVRSFYACSPFRVAMAAHLIGNEYEPAYANRAIRLLPEWTRWCAERSELPEELAQLSVAAACDAADALDKQDAEELPDPTTTAPFRHTECP